MDLLHHIDQIEELVANAQRMPIGGRAIVDRQRLLDIVDQIRVAVPNQVYEAEKVLAEREALLRDAEEEAQLLVARAEEHVTRLTSQHEIVRAAQVRAEEITQEAELRAEERLAEVNAEIQGRINESRRFSEQQMAAADRYAQELLSRLDQQLEAFRQSVRSGLDQLEAPPAALLRPPERARGGARLAAAVTPDGGAGSGSGNGNGNGRGHERTPERSRAALGTMLESPEAAASESSEPSAEEGGVIDDFAMPPLDDQPDGGPEHLPGSSGKTLADDPEQHRLGF